MPKFVIERQYLVPMRLGLGFSAHSRAGTATRGSFGITAGLVMTEALAAPDNVLHFAATRVAEITVGTVSCILVAGLFSASRTGAQTGAQIIANTAREASPALEC
jgi:hypothetical protein